MTTFTPRVRRQINKLAKIDESNKLETEHIPDNIMTADEVATLIDEKIAEAEIVIP